MLLKKLAERAEGAMLYGIDKRETEIKRLCTDSRKQTENGLFFCLSGENTDAHEFAEQALQNGAVALVCERKLDIDAPQIVVKDARLALGKLSGFFYGNPSQRMKVIGITGTNGKTTTSHMLANILKTAGKRVGVIGTLGIFYGDRKFPSVLTTPDPVELQETLAQMYICGVEYVVMEVSAHALYYHKTAGVAFSACIFTNLTQDHLDFFQTMNRYKQAKESLFLSETCPVAFLNGDDETGREIGGLRAKNKIGNGRTLFYGLQTPTDAFALITDENLRQTEAMLNVNDKLCRVSLPLTGRHNLYNALAAAACAMEFGISTDAIENGLSQVKGVSGRLERVDSFKGANIYVDFAHTPDGLAKSISSLRKHCKGRMVCLFGCGGNRDKTKRPTMGEIAAQSADFCVLTSDNPRYEDPLDIIADIEKGYRRFSVKYVVVPDRKKAIDYALDYVKCGDILLIAGKGGEEYQEIMGIKYPFNDNDIVKELLEKKGKKPL